MKAEVFIWMKIRRRLNTSYYLIRGFTYHPGGVAPDEGITIFFGVKHHKKMRI